MPLDPSTATAVASTWDSIPWSVAAALLGAAANYGALRPAISALKDEVAALKLAAAPITDIDKRLVRVETEQASIHRDLARAFDEIERKHGSMRHFIEQVRAELMQRIREDRSNPGD